MSTFDICVLVAIYLAATFFIGVMSYAIQQEQSRPSEKFPYWLHVSVAALWPVALLCLPFVPLVAFFVSLYGSMFGRKPEARDE